jgi:hypothetical protein
MAKPEPVIKKPYSTPEMTVHGTIEELTKRGGPKGNPDHGSPPSPPRTASH